MFRGRVILRSVSAGVMFSRSLTVIPSGFSSKKVKPSCVIIDRGLIRSVGGLQSGNHCDPMIRLRHIAKGNASTFSASMYQDNPNSRSLHASIPLSRASLSHMEVYTDASPRAAAGYCINDKKWFIHKWSQSINSSSLMELFAIVLAARLWGPYWSNRNVIFKTDCRSLHGCENTDFESSQMETLRNKLMRESRQHRFQPQVKFINRSENVIADRLSQNDTNGFDMQLQEVIRRELVNDLYIT